MTTEQEKNLDRTINKILNKNKNFIYKYKNGQKGLIGLFMKRTIKDSTISFYSKDSKQKLVNILKKKLMGYELEESN